MIDREHSRLSLSRQCRLLGVSRSALYYEAVGESAATLSLMGRIDKLYMDYPFYGSRQMVRHLARNGMLVGRHRVRRLMGLLGLAAIYRKPRTTVPNPDHRVYPYLLRGLTVTRSNQVWCADITYIPVQDGFLYLVAVMARRAAGRPGASRRVLAWQLANTLDCEFCLLALAEARERFGTPEIVNTDQGSQFTGGVVSMDMGMGLKRQVPGTRGLPRSAGTRTRPRISPPATVTGYSEEGWVDAASGCRRRPWRAWPQGALLGAGRRPGLPLAP